MGFYFRLSPAGGRFAAALGLRSSLLAFLLFVNELRLNLLREMPPQTCWPVFDSCGGDPQGSLGALKPRRRAQGSVCSHPGWGHPKTSPAGLCFALAPCFSREVQEELGYVAPCSPADTREGEHRARFPNKSDLAAVWVSWEARTLPQPASPGAVGLERAPACTSLFWQPGTRHRIIESIIESMV